jgi:hypothetical protein
MRRTASEVLRSLEMRVARLERQARRASAPRLAFMIGRGNPSLDNKYVEDLFEKHGLGEPESGEFFSTGDVDWYIITDEDEEEYIIIRNDGTPDVWDSGSKREMEGVWSDLVEEKQEDWEDSGLFEFNHF